MPVDTAASLKMLKETSIAANDFREGRFCNVVGEQSRLIEVIWSLMAIATKVKRLNHVNLVLYSHCHSAQAAES